MATSGETPMTGTEDRAAPPTAPPQYEFQEPENRLIRNLAWKMHFVGLFWISIGLFTIAIGGLIRHIGPIFTGTFSTLLGIWTQRASTSFKSIADTQGKDLSHLIEALEDLKKLYSLQYW